MISGKEALIALANGEEVELQVSGDTYWHDSTQWTVKELLCFKGKFRLKPQTITINGIELARPEHIDFESDFGLLIHFENHEQRQKFKEALRSISR